MPEERFGKERCAVIFGRVLNRRLEAVWAARLALRTCRTAANVDQGLGQTSYKAQTSRRNAGIAAAT
jgi:hypothetical protein